MAEADETDASPRAPRSSNAAGVLEAWPSDGDEGAEAGNFSRITTFTNAPPPHAGSNAKAQQSELLGRVHMRASAEDGGDWVPLGGGGHEDNSSAAPKDNSKVVDENTSNDEGETWADFTGFASNMPAPDGKLNDGEQRTPQKPVINDRRQKYGSITMLRCYCNSYINYSYL